MVRIFSANIVVSVVFLSAMSCQAVLGLKDEELDCRDDAQIPEALLRSCVLRASCAVNTPDLSLSGCVDNNEPGASPFHACTATAQTCTDIEDCRGSGLVDPVVCQGTTNWRCDGTRAIRNEARTLTFPRSG